MSTEVERPAAEEPAPPRLRVTKGSPWRIDARRRAKWYAEEFIAANAAEIRQIGDPVLHAPARKPRLSRAHLEEVVGRMFASMVAAQGIGLAAPQIGVPLRICIMDVDAAGIVAVNPEVQWTSGEVAEASEGCLSVRGFYGMVERPVAARLVATDLGGRRFTVEGQQLGAQCLLHETDHLGGHLYLDRLRSRADLHPVEPAEEEAAPSA